MSRPVLRLLALLACVPLLAAWYWPMTNDAEVAEGQRAFRAGDFDSAVQAFRKAMRKQGDGDRLQYDLGTALLRSAMASTADEQRNTLLDHSIAALRRATDSKDARVRERALYNLGNALALRHRYDEALASYRSVLLDNADHEDARFNLELVLLVKRQEVAEQHQAASGSGRDGEGQDEGQGQGPAPQDTSSDGQSPANPGDSGSGQGSEASADNGRAQEAGAGQAAAPEKEPATSLKAQTDYAGIQSQAVRSMDNLTLVQKLEALERRSGELRRSNLLRKSRERLRDPNKKGSWQ